MYPVNTACVVFFTHAGFETLPRPVLHSLYDLDNSTGWNTVYFHEKCPAFCRCIENISCFSPTVLFTEDAVGFHLLFLFLCAIPPFSRVRADARHAARLALFVNTNLFPFSFSCHLPFLVSPRFYLVLTTSVGRWVSLPSPQSSH